MNSLVLGVIGHVNHGKTALVHALTGQRTDRLPEEKQRGISIALGFAHLDTGAGRIDLIDMPGHEGFVRTMVSGATGIDAALLVVSANEGIKPQTVEHANIAGLLGLQRAVVVVSKADLAAPHDAQRVGSEALDLLARAGLRASPPVHVSTRTGSGIAALRSALGELAAEQAPRPADRILYLPIDRAFAIPGHGPVVTGTLRGAGISQGDTLELLPGRRTVRVRGLQIHGQPTALAQPGQRVAVNLRGVGLAELERGMSLAAPDALASSDWLTLALRSAYDAPPLRNGMRLRLLLGTRELGTRLRLLDRDILDPGEDGFAQLRCDAPVMVPAGEHAILRLPSPPRTVAGGRVLESPLRRQRRHHGAMLQRLTDLRDLPPDDLLFAEIRHAGPAGTTLRKLSRVSGLAAARIPGALDALPVVTGRTGLVVSKAEMEGLMIRIPTLLSTHVGGLQRDALLAALPGVGRAVLDAAIGRLQARRLVVERGSRLMLPDPEADRRRTRDEADLAARIASLLRDSGLSPPAPDQVMPDPPATRAVNRLIRSGDIVRAVDRAKRKELLFHRDAIDEAKRRLAPVLGHPGLRVGEISRALGVSRKYVMPLLDHLDNAGFTHRIMDRRVLGRTDNTTDGGKA